MHKDKTGIKRRHRILTWKTHNSGKNHGSPQTAEYTMMRRLQRWEHKGKDLLHPLSSPHATVTTRRQLPLSLPLSITRFVQLLFTKYQQPTTKMCALSHIYTYMTFGLFTQMSTPIGRTDRYRFWDQSVLSISSIRRKMFPNNKVGQQRRTSIACTRPSENSGCKSESNAWRRKNVRHKKYDHKKGEIEDANI